MKKKPEKDKVAKKDFSRFTLPKQNEETGTLPTTETKSVNAVTFWGTGVGKIWTIGFIGLIVAGLTVGLFIYGATSKSNNPQSTSIAITPTIQITTTATPSVKEINIADYKIKVLNGSGIQGEAAKVKKLLMDESFNVAEIGNAGSSDNNQTVIQAKTGTPESILKQLKDLLGKSYTISVLKDLPDSENADVVVTVGQ